MLFIVDPFFWFCAFALAVPPFWVGHNTQQTIEYFSDPFMIGSVAFSLLVSVFTHYITRTPSAALSSFDAWRARWYLLNGVIIHFYLDGLIGAYKVNKTLASQYAILDKRYNDHGPLGQTLHVISVIELALYMPACVWLYWAFWKGKAYRASLEVFVASFQLYGTLIYILTEAMNEFKSFTYWNRRAEYWDLNVIFYLYFAVFVGVALWIIVPLWLIYCAFAETATIPNQPIKIGKFKKP
jgi:hypothetical protein